MPWGTGAQALRLTGAPRETSVALALNAVVRAGVGYGVLHVAGGAGGQSLVPARRVSPSGQVPATDISPAILQRASGAAAAAVLTTVRTRKLDGERLDVDPAAFNAVTSCLGLIYFPDQTGALASQYGALPGGRISAIVYSTAERNISFFDSDLNHPSPGPKARGDHGAFLACPG